MATVAIELPDEAFSAMKRPPPEFAQSMRLAAAIHWYAQEKISMEKAAMIAGLDRADFLDARPPKRWMFSRWTSKACNGNWSVADSTAVVNASPLIFLTKAGMLDLLQLAAPWVIPIMRQCTLPYKYEFQTLNIWTRKTKKTIIHVIDSLLRDAKAKKAYSAHA